MHLTWIATERLQRAAIRGDSLGSVAHAVQAYTERERTQDAALSVQVAFGIIPTGGLKRWAF